MFSSRSFIVSGLMFRSLIHFEFVFVYGVRKCSSFILLQVVDQFSQHHFLKRLSFSHCIFLPPLSKIQVSIGSWIYLWPLYSVPLIYISVTEHFVIWKVAKLHGRGQVSSVRISCWLQASKFSCPEVSHITSSHITIARDGQMTPPHKGAWK